MPEHDHRPEFVTVGELDRALDGVTKALEIGFDGVNRRLDQGVKASTDTNNKIGEIAVDLATVCEKSDSHARSIRTLYSRLDDVTKPRTAVIVGTKTAAAATAAGTNAGDGSATISLTISPKMWASIGALAAGSTVFAPVVIEWVKSLLGALLHAMGGTQ